MALKTVAGTRTAEVASSAGPVAGRCGRRFLVIVACAATLLACGGGSGGQGGPSPQGAAAPVATSPAALPSGFAAPATVGTGPLPAAASNVLRVRVDRGVRGTAFNSPYVTVTVCVPGGTPCRDIDHVLLDTHSWGLRLAASAVPPELALPLVRTADGAPIGQCVHFAGGYAWGSVRSADVRLSGESITGLPLQVIGDAEPALAVPPPECRSPGTNLGARLDANGVLGVGMLRYDCGTACTTSTAPAIYFGCTERGCTPATVPLRQQVVNPVALLATHNNGVALVLQQVPGGGASSLEGALVLGIGTAANNQLGSAQVLPTDGRYQLTTVYKGRAYPSIIDSGANVVLLPDGDLATCGDVFCPAQPTTVQAQLQSPTGAQRDVTLTLESIGGLLAGSVAQSIGAKDAEMVTWGLPFFFGRTVFVALKDAVTPAGSGPYWAF